MSSDTKQRDENTDVKTDQGDDSHIHVHAVGLRLFAGAEELGAVEDTPRRSVLFQKQFLSFSD